MTQRQSHTTYKQNSLNSLVINSILIRLVSHQNIGAESKAELHLLYHSVGAARQLQQAEARISFQAEEDPIWSMWGKSRTWCNGCLWQHRKWVSAPLLLFFSEAQRKEGILPLILPLWLPLFFLPWPPSLPPSSHPAAVSAVCWVTTCWRTEHCSVDMHTGNTAWIEKSLIWALLRNNPGMKCIYLQCHSQVKQGLNPNDTLSGDYRWKFQRPRSRQQWVNVLSSNAVQRQSEIDSAVFLDGCSL